MRRLLLLIICTAALAGVVLFSTNLLGRPGRYR